ncbi:hypothetical protein KY362_03460 [Candidatus Woesearchaeota archaeon]|nr:hypothetical protein [Candidatus Woesearchaeota archaeon]
MFDQINEFLRNINPSMGGGALPGMFICLIIILAGITLLQFHRKRGTIMHPKAHPENYLADFVGLVNRYLRELQSDGGVIHAISEKAGYRGMAKIEGQLHPAQVDLKHMVHSKIIFSLHLAKRKEVAAGNYGRVFLNAHHFKTRPMHHCFAMNIASQLVYCQLYALGGKDPKEMPKKEMVIGGKAILERAGMMGKYADMDDHWVFDLLRREHKLDDAIARTLAISEKDVESITKQLKIKAAVAGSRRWLMDNGWKAKLATLLEIERRHMAELLELMDRKAESIKKEKSRADGSVVGKYEEFLQRWKSDREYVSSIIKLLDKTLSTKDKWRAAATEEHATIREKNITLQEAMQSIGMIEHSNGIDIYKVEAVLTSLTHERGRIHKELYWEEGLMLAA